MDGKRLLERIRQMDRGVLAQEQDSPEALQNSILNHLVKLLNTRQGSTIVGQEFGIPDFSALTTSFDAETIKSIEKGLFDVVSRYERRLKNIQITFVPDPKEPLKIQFSLAGELVGFEEDVPVVFETVLTQSGKITVKTSS